MSATPYDAILVLSFGGPEGPDDVMPFLENVLRGRNVPRERMAEVAHHYALFGGVSLIVRWVLPLGVAYIVVFEGFCANIDFAVRRVTVLWYVRILAERWFGFHIAAWKIKLDEAPSGTEAVVTLGTAALVMAIAAAWLFGTRELRVKTPDGS